MRPNIIRKPKQLKGTAPLPQKTGSPLPQGYNSRNFRKILLHMCQKHEFKMPQVLSRQNKTGYTSTVIVQLPGANKEVPFVVSAQTKKLAEISAYAEAVSAFTQAQLLTAQSTP